MLAMAGSKPKMDVYQRMILTDTEDLRWHAVHEQQQTHTRR
jgi:hypothetical protein